MYCPECNKETPDEAQFCFECGTRVNKECPRCASVIRLRARMCLHCKHELTDDDFALFEKEERQRLERRDEAQRRMELQQFNLYNPPALIATWWGVLKCQNCGTFHEVKYGLWGPETVKYRDIYGALRNDRCRFCGYTLDGNGENSPFDVPDFTDRQVDNAKKKCLPKGYPVKVTQGPILKVQTAAVEQASPSKQKLKSVWTIGHRTGLALAMLVAIFRYLQHVANYGWSASTAYPEFIGDMFVLTVVGYVAGCTIGIIAAGLWRAMKSD